MKRKDPVILLGAARSGTKLLRSILGKHSQLSVIPYDINYIWTMGNFGKGHDELDPADLTPEIRDFIRSYLERFIGKGADDRVVEKTVSNTLRIPFVDQVFPDAQYVVIIRDGRDVAGSAREQWSSRSSGSPIVAKLKTFPLKHAWAYGFRYVYNYLSGMMPWNDSVKSWGPRFRDMDDFYSKNELITTCAMQWSRSVELTLNGLDGIPKEKVHFVSYEVLVQNPTDQVKGVLEFLGLSLTPSVEEYCRNRVSDNNIGKWKNQIRPEELTMIKDIIDPVMERVNQIWFSQKATG